MISFPPGSGSRQIERRKIMTTSKTVKPVPETAAPADVQTASATDLTEQVRTLAYTLYEQRGSQEGYAEQDWLQAEAEILGLEKTLKAAA
jgi:Protein of unknown function (DUF2934)